MRCSKCGTDNRAGRKFCAQCGTPLKPVCPACGAENEPGEKFCGDCGAATAVSAAAAQRPSPATLAAIEIRVTPEYAEASALSDGERKTVTALFADIKGSTELIRDLDPEEARAIIDPALNLMIDAAHRYDGYVVQSTGDGIFALFGAPLAHEDHPQRALHAALAMQQQLRNYAQADHRLKPVPLEVRIGINTGEVVLRMVHTGGHTEYTPVGHATNLAARMQTVAPTGGIVISEDTRHLVEGYFELRALGPTEVKGISEPINVYEVVGAGAARGHFELAARRGLTKFVGREREVAEMKRALDLARGGHGQIVAAVAEAGTGKSRLFYEFKATLPTECKVLEAYPVSHGKSSAWLPVLGLLYLYFGIEEADNKAPRRAKIEARLSGVDPALNDTLPLLYTLMGLHEGPDPLAQMDPQIKRQRTLDAIKRIILRESLNQPLVVIFEDLHWIDSQTQELLDLLADTIANSRTLLLVNYRPEHSHPWGNKSYYSQLRLDALGHEGAQEMLSTLLGDGVELDPLKRMVIERTEGNPFFIEEMVRALFDEGALVRNGVVKVARSLPQVRLPPTVQGILAARIDRLAAEHKELLQTLAVMGRESPIGLIRQVSSTRETQLERMLAGLQAGEFIHEQPATGDIKYVFKHALTQEVAYNSLLIERRKILHERAAVAMESLYTEQLDDHLNELAHHYSRSDNVSKAVEYLGRAGKAAEARNAFKEALESYQQAAALLATLPESPERDLRELELTQSVVRMLEVASGFSTPETIDARARAQALAEKSGNLTQLATWMIARGISANDAGDFPAAGMLADQALELALRDGSPTVLAHAHTLQLQTRYWRGDLAGAEEHFAAGLEFFDDPGFRQLLAGVVVAYGLAASNAWVFGRADIARERMAQMMAAANESNSFIVAFSTSFAASLQILLREYQQAEALAASALELSEKNQIPLIAALCRCALGRARAQLGHPTEGIALIRHGIAGLLENGTHVGDTVFTAWLAEAQAHDGAIADALETVEQALRVNPGEVVSKPDTLRLRGELRLKQGHSELAETDFREAIALAQEMGAKSLELRATMSLARLFAKQGRRDEARGMLVEIYGWFTEGFDTADLKDAKALLDKLAG